MHVYACMQPDSKCLTSPDRYEYGQIPFFFLHLLLQLGKYHCCKQAASQYVSQSVYIYWSLSLSLFLSLLFVEERFENIYDFSEISRRAKAVNLLHWFYRRAKKMKKKKKKHLPQAAGTSLYCY